MDNKSFLSRRWKVIIIYAYGISNVFYFLVILAPGDMLQYMEIPFQFYPLLYPMNIAIGLIFIIFASFLSIKSAIRPASLMVAALIVGGYIVHETGQEEAAYLVNMLKFPPARTICNLNRCKNGSPDMTIIAAASWDECASLIVSGDTATIINKFNGYQIREITNRYQSFFKCSF